MLKNYFRKLVNIFLKAFLICLSMSITLYYTLLIYGKLFVKDKYEKRYYIEYNNFSNIFFISSFYLLIPGLIFMLLYKNYKNVYNQYFFSVIWIFITLIFFIILKIASGTYTLSFSNISELILLIFFNLISIKIFLK